MVSDQDYKKAVEKMGREPINPIGSCFDSAAHNFVFGETEAGDRICHGVGVANMPGQEGQTFSHAWIEFTKGGVRMAFDAIWGFVIPSEAYREQLKLSYVVEYGKDEFLSLWRHTDFPGPWDKRVARFTTEGKRLANVDR